MLPHALESNVFALEIQSQLRTDPGTAYGALVDPVIFHAAVSKLPRPTHQPRATKLIPICRRDIYSDKNEVGERATGPI